MLVPWFIAPGTTATFYVFLVLVMSPVCFALYGIDKRRAVGQRARISDRTLQLTAFVGGWPGAWLGQRVFRYPCDRFLFRWTFRLIVVTHAAFLALVVLGLVLR